MSDQVVPMVFPTISSQVGQPALVDVSIPPALGDMSGSSMDLTRDLAYVIELGQAEERMTEREVEFQAELESQAEQTIYQTMWYAETERDMAISEALAASRVELEQHISTVEERASEHQSQRDSQLLAHKLHYNELATKEFRMYEDYMGNLIRHDETAQAKRATEHVELYLSTEFQSRLTASERELEQSWQHARADMHSRCVAELTRSQAESNQNCERLHGEVAAYQAESAGAKLLSEIACKSFEDICESRARATVAVHEQKAAEAITASNVAVASRNTVSTELNVLKTEVGDVAKRFNDFSLQTQAEIHRWHEQTQEVHEQDAKEFRSEISRRDVQIAALRSEVNSRNALSSPPPRVATVAPLMFPPSAPLTVPVAAPIVKPSTISPSGVGFSLSAPARTLVAPTTTPSSSSYPVSSRGLTAHHELASVPVSGGVGGMPAYVTETGACTVKLFQNI